MRLLLVEDENIIANPIREALRKRYVVDVASTGEDAEFQAGITPYDGFIIDWMLPDMEGTDVCRYLRSRKTMAPILMLTGRTSVRDKVQALELGADDYLTKPFSFEELEMRVHAMLRRSQPVAVNNTLTAGTLVLNTLTRIAYRNGKEIILRRKEFDLLEVFMRNPRQVLSRSRLMESAWEEGIELESNTVDVHIKTLRDKIDRPFLKPLLKTVAGVGYVLEP